MENKTIWQIAAGEVDRDYSSLFIEHDLMLIGPSRHLGAVNQETYGNAIGLSMYAQVNRFAKNPVPGDIIVLRSGKKIKAIGKIPDLSSIPEDQLFNGYSLRPEFDGIYGWDLGHCRRVIWAEGCDISPIANLSSNAIVARAALPYRETPAIPTRFALRVCNM